MFLTRKGSVVEEIRQGVGGFCFCVESAQEFVLHVSGEASSLARPTDHFVCDVFCGCLDKFVRRNGECFQKKCDGLGTEITFNILFHGGIL